MLEGGSNALGTLTNFLSYEVQIQREKVVKAIAAKEVYLELVRGRGGSLRVDTCKEMAQVGANDMVSVTGNFPVTVETRAGQRTYAAALNIPMDKEVS